MSKGLAISLGLVVFLLGMGVGYFLTPEYAMDSVNMKQTHGLGAADQWVDLRYLNNMIAHHLSAIHLLEQAQAQSARPEIQSLAEAVITADQAGIEELYTLRQEWYGAQRPITTFTQINLGTGDEKFDLRLLNALIAHHQEALASAKEISTKTTRNEVLDIADEVTQTLSANKTQLEAWRQEWYGF